MENTQLWAAFSTLNKTELRELDRFVRSPFFNRKDHVTALFEYLRDCLEARQTPDSALAFRAAYPGAGAFDDQKMRLANSHLLAVLEQYWLHIEKFADDAKTRLELAAIYRRRNLPKHARITLREAREAHAQLPWRDAAFLDKQHDLELERFQLESAAKRYEEFNLQAISDWLDRGFIARKLRHSCLALSHQTVFKTNYDFGLLAGVSAFVEQENLAQHPAIGLYYHACKFLNDPAAEDHFFAFRALLSEYAEVFPPDEQRTLYLLAINFGVKKTNTASNPTWDRANFELYREALTRDLLLDNGVLSHFAYNNIVIAALRLGETAWAEDFIHRYKPALERKYRESTFSMNMARMAYLKKDYHTALIHLQRADYRDFIHSVNAKILQMKIFFETGESDLLESHLDSMQHYIRRQRAVGYHRVNCLNIVRYTRALLRCNRRDMGEAGALRRQIEQEPVLTEKEWLLARL